MHTLAPLPPALADFLRDFANRRRRHLLLRAGGWALATLTAWVLLACAADRLLHLPGELRAVLLVAGVSASALAGLALLRPLRGSTDWLALVWLIEQHDPRFEQRLITVTSRLLGSPQHRGSDEILGHLVRDVERRLALARAARVFPLRPTLVPWTLLLILTLLLLGLARVPGLGVNRLLARLVDPTSPYPPVTTTALAVTPGDVDVYQSDPLRIEVATERLGSGNATLYLQDSGGGDSRYGMEEAGGGRFVYTVTSVSRDFTYRVTGGDASAGPFSVRVKRPPAVAEFHVRYTYPAYTNRPPGAATNTDGAIEAPAGSTAVLTIVATEPLQSALLSVGDQKILMERGDNERSRTATLHINHDATYDVDLISTREVRGSGPSRMPIHVDADRPPVVRLALAGQTLRLGPRDLLPLGYAAMDDYALDSLSLTAQVNGQAPRRFGLEIRGDRRRQEQTLNLDLSRLGVEIGDVVTLTAGAHDTAGQETVSGDLRVLISPKPFDLDARERIDALAAAGRFTANVVDQLKLASRSLDDAEGRGRDRQSADYLAAAGSASRGLASASESGTLLRQSLERAAAHSDNPSLCIALAAGVDVAQQEVGWCDELFRRVGSPEGPGGGARARTRRAYDQARDLLGQIGAIAAAEKAGALLDEREDLKAAETRPVPADPRAADRVTQTLQRVSDEIKAGLAELGIDPAGDVDSQLRNRVSAGRSIAQAKQPVDLLGPAREEAQTLSRDPAQPGGMSARLACAAAVEAIRPDADLVRARDLDLAARAFGAVEKLAAQTPAGKPAPAASLNLLVHSMEAMWREQGMQREKRTPDEQRAIRAAAGHARDALAKLIADSDGEKNPASPAQPASPASPASPMRPGDLEAMALRAGAESARHDYHKAAEQDALLWQALTDAAGKPGGKPLDSEAPPATTQLMEERLARIDRATSAVARQMAGAEELDRLIAAQEKLARETRASKAASRDLADRQGALAGQILQLQRRQGQGALSTQPAVVDPAQPGVDWHGHAMGVVLLAQEQLALLPGQLASVQQTADAWRAARQRAIAAQLDFDESAPEAAESARRLADEANNDEAAAALALKAALDAIAPSLAGDLPAQLDAIIPESQGERAALATLATALAPLQTLAGASDGRPLWRACAEVRKAIEPAQRELAAAADALVRRDPLNAAQSLARGAADWLARHPEDPRPAVQRQGTASAALGRAWEQSIRKAADARLALLPSLQMVYAPPASAPGESPLTAFAPSFTPRDLQGDHTLTGADPTAAITDPQPPGYEEPLRLYFQAMGKAEEAVRTEGLGR